MKQVTLKIQDKKFRFFMELLQQFDFVEVEEEIEIPEVHKKLVRKRIKKTNEQLLDWDEAAKKISLD